MLFGWVRPLLLKIWDIDMTATSKISFQVSRLVIIIHVSEWIESQRQWFNLFFLSSGFQLLATWLRPRCTLAVSLMYMILPSLERTKMNPSRVWSRWDPSSWNQLYLLPSCGIASNLWQALDALPIVASVSIDLSTCTQCYQEKTSQNWIMFQRGYIWL